MWLRSDVESDVLKVGLTLHVVDLGGGIKPSNSMEKGKQSSFGIRKRMNMAKTALTSTLSSLLTIVVSCSMVLSHTNMAKEYESPAVIEELNLDGVCSRACTLAPRQRPV